MKARNLVLLISASFLIILLLTGMWVKNLVGSFFEPFNVTIENKSDTDIVAIETGIPNSSSDVYSDALRSGKSVKLKPKLQLSGEGMIYLKYTDADGSESTVTICGYTEYLSGNAHVVISNDGVDVTQECY
ncbi:hypothetical protein EBB07_10400 [Paenibacillaceae bacterium]|nr:hypothetical protein EBB07_10400 [Paenibacillaceae bacterium]